MTTALYDAAGRSIPLGKEVGRGGEGSVYMVPSVPGQVAKVYLAPTAERAAKLREMLTMTGQGLGQYVAWPTQTLSRQPHGPVCGFLMPKIDAKSPSHVMYSPQHRQQEHPEIKWDF